MKKQAIIVDLDGTLADCEHRRKFKENGKLDYKHFSNPDLIAADPINKWCEELAWAMHRQGYCLVFVSGREDSKEAVTLDWLMDNGIPVEALFMRKDGDYRKDFEVKFEIYEKHIRDDYEILFVVDDRKQVVDMWREIGLTVLHCAEGDF